MRRVFPDKPAYTDEDLSEIKYIHINWMNKAVKHSKIRATSNMNSDPAKSLTQPTSL
jgi:hypothetical protein